MARKIRTSKNTESPKKFNMDPTDSRYLDYEIAEEVMSSYGFIYLENGKSQPYTTNEEKKNKYYWLQNDYDAHHWNRRKKGFLPENYKGFSIMEYVDDGWNARHNYRYHKDIRKSYYPYIKINHNLYISFITYTETGLTQEEMTDFANGNTEHANEKSIATEILDKIKQKIEEKK